MISTKSAGTFTGAGVFAAIAASLCCITPVIALLAGSSSIVANFSWIEPARPYLVSLSIVVLAFAWYFKLKPAEKSFMWKIQSSPEIACQKTIQHDRKGSKKVKA